MAKTKLKLRAPRKSYTVGGKRYVEGTLYDDIALNSDVNLSDLKAGGVTVFELVEAKKRKKKPKKQAATVAPDPASETTVSAAEAVAGGEGDGLKDGEPAPIVQPNDAAPADVEQPADKNKKAAKKKAVGKKTSKKKRRVL